MNPLVERSLPQIEDLCRRYRVRSLHAFGSVLTDSFDPARSDVDFLVEFDDAASIDYVDAYFGLKENLEQLLHRPVDLITTTSLRNPYFRNQIMRTRQSLYAA
ncbi:MAG TPA: nucleotidyltransferase domain-containing protein [Kineosporiaceae bacterium]